MRSLLLAVGLMCAGNLASAATVTFEWSARITNVERNLGAILGTDFGVGDTISGTVSYDPTQPDLDPDPNSSEVAAPDLAVTGQIGSQTFSFGQGAEPGQTAIGPVGLVLVDNRRDVAPEGSVAAFTVFANDSSDILAEDRNVPTRKAIIVNDEVIERGSARIRFEFSTPTFDFFPDAALTETIDIDALRVPIMSLNLSKIPNGSNSLSLTGLVTEFRRSEDPVVAPVPVPAPLALSALGLGALTLVRFSGGRASARRQSGRR